MPKPEVDESGNATLRMNYLGYHCTIEFEDLFGGDRIAIRFAIRDETGEPQLCVDGNRSFTEKSVTRPDTDEINQPRIARDTQQPKSALTARKARISTAINTIRQ